jgi:hypothetical protein
MNALCAVKELERSSRSFSSAVSHGGAVLCLAWLGLVLVGVLEELKFCVSSENGWSLLSTIASGSFGIWHRQPDDADGKQMILLISIQTS